MFDTIKKFQGENKDVTKFVFEKKDICVEAVLYKYESYEKRTVLCISTQCGCPVGCTFCGTGKQFIRNLTHEEIYQQVVYVIDTIENELKIDSLNARCEKFQIMFMSMGEPMLNWMNVSKAMTCLNMEYPNAQLLLSTMGINDPEVFENICIKSKNCANIGLQFSVHSGFNRDRNRLIPFHNKMNLRQLRDAGIRWNKATGRPVFLNFCVDEWNMNTDETHEIKNLFSPEVFNLTFSVICDNKEGDIKAQQIHAVTQDKICQLMSDFVNDGYNVRIFDPAGQEIGGGCGQLFYVQNWMKENNTKVK